MENSKLFDLSKKQSDALKGVFVILVILHHYSHEISGVLNTVFLGAGALACSGFFFLSGYGIKKTEKYMSNFRYWGKKIRRMLSVLIIINIIYVLYFYVFRDYTFSWHTIFDILGIDSMNHPVWFLWALILLYMAVYCSFIIHKSPVVASLCACVGIVMIFGPGAISCISFPLGFLYAKWQNRIENYKYSSSLLILVSVISTILYTNYVYEQGFLNSIPLLSAFIIMCICFNGLGILIKNLLERCRYLIIIGHQSLFPYLTHALAIYVVIDFFSPCTFTGFCVLIFVTTTLSCVLLSMDACLNTY